MDNESGAKGDKSGEKLAELERKIKELEKDNFTLREHKRQYKEKLDVFETQLTQKEQEALQSQNKHKELWELAQKKNSELEERLKQFETEKVESKKSKAIMQELLKFNFDPSYSKDAMALIDRNKVIVDPETNTVIGASDAAKEFAQRYTQTTQWFKKQAVGVNHSSSSPTTKPGRIDVRDFKSKEDLRAYWKKKQGL